MKEQFRASDSNAQNELMEETARKSMQNHAKQQYDKTIFFSPEETQNKICKLPNKKTPSLNGITNNALKRCDKKVIIQLTNIFNGCVRAEYFLQSRKIVTMIMIQKLGKDPLNPINHRPILLLNTMFKYSLDEAKSWNRGNYIQKIIFNNK